MSTLWEECFSRKILIGGCPFGMTVGTQARWLVRMAVNSAGRNLEISRRKYWVHDYQKWLCLSVFLLTCFSKVILFPCWTWHHKDILCWKHTQLYTLTDTLIQTHTHSISMIHFSILTASVYFPSCLMTQHCHGSGVQSHAMTAGVSIISQSWEQLMAHKRRDEIQ